MVTKEKSSLTSSHPSIKSLQALGAQCKTSPSQQMSQPIRSHSAPKTRIIIRYDVGFSNTIFLRGRGANLSWEKGIPLINHKADEWVWETTAPFTNCEFKVLINDTTYENGNNHTLTCGASVSYTPQFH